jgi:NADPH2:quinone reductase
MTTVERVIVRQFGDTSQLGFQHRELPPIDRGVRVRVTHVSVGSTDALARSGGYLLQPRAPFTPGYDFVGVIDSYDLDAVSRGLRLGTRVAGVLPRMGSNVSYLTVDARILVALPSGLASEIAATLPLDLVTAAQSVALAGRLPVPVALVQGASGPVGSLIAQLLMSTGVEVIGTASRRSRAYVDGIGARFVDYRDADWPTRVHALAPRGVGASFDHTGSAEVRRLTAHSGAVVRTAFAGRPGRERRDTVTGGAASTALYFGRPRERVCSVPLIVATQTDRYRELLADGLDRVAAGELRAPTPRVLPFREVARAHRELAELNPGEKIVLALER